MQLFSRLYQSMLGWAQHRFAERYLAILAFAESSFFPIPVEVMLLPMTLSRPAFWWRFALIATVFSVAGGVLGYLIGFFGYEYIEPVIVKFGYAERFATVLQWFGQWGFWVVFIAGFSPLPYKLFTIGAGMLQLSWLPFVIASIVGRGARFFLVSLVVAKAGPKVAPLILKYIEWIGWALVVAFCAVGLWLYLR